MQQQREELGSTKQQKTICEGSKSYRLNNTRIIGRACQKDDELLEGGRVLWSERPFNQPAWSKYVGEDGVGRIFYYDENTGHGYAGCCDLIYMDQNAEIVLADFKLGRSLQCRFPNKNRT